MTVPTDGAHSPEDIDALARQALAQAISSTTHRDKVTDDAIRFMKGATKLIVSAAGLIVLVVAVAVILAVIFVVPKIDHTDNRSVTNSRILVCTANGYNELARDLRTLAASHGHAGPADYKIPPDCKIAP